MEDKEKIKQLEDQIVLLKARIFDANETATNQYSLAEQFRSTLGVIADHLNLVGENITLQEIVDVIKEKYNPD